MRKSIGKQTKSAPNLDLDKGLLVCELGKVQGSPAIRDFLLECSKLGLKLILLPAHSLHGGTKHRSSWMAKCEAKAAYQPLLLRLLMQPEQQPQQAEPHWYF